MSAVAYVSFVLKICYLMTHTRTQWYSRTQLLTLESSLVCLFLFYVSMQYEEN